MDGMAFISCDGKMALAHRNEPEMPRTACVSSRHNRMGSRECTRRRSPRSLKSSTAMPQPMREPDPLTPPWMADFLDLKNVSLVLDVGCGDGALTAYLRDASSSHARAIGLDRDPQALSRARSRNITSVRGDALHLPLRSDSADLVVCRRLLMNLTSPLDAVREMIRVAKRGGQISALEPDFLAEHGYSTVPGELDFLRKLLVLTSEGSVLDFGRRVPALFEQAGLAQIQARVHSPVTVSRGDDPPTIHRDMGGGRLTEAIERWRGVIEPKIGLDFESLLSEAKALDMVRDQQVAAGEYSSFTSFPLWVVRGRKA